MRKLTYEFVKEEFENEGYILVSKEYKNAHQKLNYICPKEHKHKITWNDWQQGRRCYYCFGSVPLTIDFIKKEFEKEGYKLLTKIYKNSKQKLDYICPKDHKHFISWVKWQQGQRCPYCANVVKPTIDFIREEFEKEGYKFLTDYYTNGKQKLDYICSEGHEHSIRWDDWQQKHRCPTCFFIRNSGSGNSAWKGGISYEPYCPIWKDKEFKESIKERDGYKCLNPDCRKNCDHLSLECHHIDNNKKNCEPNNLITVCKSCNARAQKDREWHTSWYKAIIEKRIIRRN